MFSNVTYASYIQDLNYPIPEQLVQIQEWKTINCYGGAYEFLPSLYEWISWGFNPEDYSKLKAEDAIKTKHNEVNTWEISYGDRFCKLMYNFSDYNLISFISMYNELIPYQSVAYGDENLKFNYPFDIREYSWLELQFNSIDWKDQERWLKIRKYLLNNMPDYIDFGWSKSNKENNYKTMKNNWTDSSMWSKILSLTDDIEINEKNKEFLYRTNIPKTITLFSNLSPTAWSLPASPGDFGLIGNIGYNTSLVSKTRKDYSYFHSIGKNVWNYSPYNMWRSAPYASRWYFADIVNAVAGELNMRAGRNKEDTYPYDTIPDYFWNKNNIILPISKGSNRKQGIQKIYEYCKIMNCLPYTTSPNLSCVDVIFHYSTEIFQCLDNPYKFIPFMAKKSNEVRAEIEKNEKIEIDNSTWYYTIAYMINARGVDEYK